MNQTQIQQRKEDRILAKAKYIVENKRIIKHVSNIWCVQSGNDKTPEVFYCVMFDKELDCLTCDCKDFSIRGATRPCCHICSVALWEANN